MARVVEAVNLRERWAMFSDGTRADVVLLDIDHDRTQNLEEAVTFVIYAPRLPEGPFWFEMSVEALPKATVH